MLETLFSVYKTPKQMLNQLHQKKRDGSIAALPKLPSLIFSKMYLPKNP